MQPSSSLTARSQTGGAERLEPYAGKLARTVLGGEHISNGVLLPDEKAIAHPTDSRLLEVAR